MPCGKDATCAVEQDVVGGGVLEGDMLSQSRWTSASSSSHRLQYQNRVRRHLEAMLVIPMRHTFEEMKPRRL
jgi:hypothetical protein